VPGHDELVAGDNYGVCRVLLNVEKLGDVALGVGNAFDYYLYAVPQVAQGL